MKVLKMNLCEDGFSFSSEGGVLTIENGIQGTTSFAENSVIMLTDCSDDKICNNPMKPTAPDQLTIWGNTVDCSSNVKNKITLNPSDFGYSTPEELQTAIEAAIIEAEKTPVEILETEKETLYTLGGKNIFRKAIRVSGFSTGAGYTHNLNIDNYVSIKIYSWINGSPEDKRELAGEGTGRTSQMYADLQANAFDEIITDTNFDELLIVLEYTKL